MSTFQSRWPERRPRTIEEIRECLKYGHSLALADWNLSHKIKLIDNEIVIQKSHTEGIIKLVDKHVINVYFD